MDRDHEHDPAKLVGWALAASRDDADRILTTLNGCARCASEAARLRGAVHWLGFVEPVEPPPGLRAKVLARARAGSGRTAPAQTLAYAGQVAAMDALLARLTQPDWQATVPGDRDVRQLIVHLSANDTQVAEDIGLTGTARAETGPQTRRAWREGAIALLDEVRPRAADRLDQPVQLAGRRPAMAPLRDGLVQRAFETWIHADDIRTAVGLPPSPPPPEHVRLIADLGARLLPIALAALGTGPSGGLARLELNGPGGAVWDVPLGPDPVTGPPAAVITMDAVEFCRLLAGRRDPAALSYDVDGDASLARVILRAAATLGCE